MNNQRRPQRAFPAGGAFVLSIFRFHPDLKAEHQLQCLLPTIQAVEERPLLRAEPVVVGRCIVDHRLQLTAPEGAVGLPSRKLLR